MQLLNEAAGACLKLHYATLVVGHRADRLEALLERALLRFGGPHAQVLHHAGADRHGAGIRFLPGVFRHELHVHEGRFAGFVELLLRIHRVVPVQNFPLRLRLRRGGGRRAHQAMVGEAIAAVAARRERHEYENGDGKACHCSAPGTYRNVRLAQALARSASAWINPSSTSVLDRSASSTPASSPRAPSYAASAAAARSRASGPSTCS